MTIFIFRVNITFSASKLSIHLCTWIIFLQVQKIGNFCNESYNWVTEIIAKFDNFRHIFVGQPERKLWFVDQQIRISMSHVRSRKHYFYYLVRFVLIIINLKLSEETLYEPRQARRDSNLASRLHPQLWYNWDGNINYRPWQ